MVCLPAMASYSITKVQDVEKHLLPEKSPGPWPKLALGYSNALTLEILTPDVIGAMPRTTWKHSGVCFSWRNLKTLSSPLDKCIVFGNLLRKHLHTLAKRSSGKAKVKRKLAKKKAQTSFGLKSTLDTTVPLRLNNFWGILPR